MSSSSIKFCSHCGSALKTVVKDQHERLICSNDACDFIHWNNPTPVVAAIIEYRGEMLLVNHHRWPDGMLGLVTGFLEAGEDPAEAVQREVKEELNLDSQRVEWVGLYPFAQANQLLIVYFVQAEGELRLNEELAAYKLIPREKLKPWAFGTGPAVRDWLATQQEYGI